MRIVIALFALVFMSGSALAHGYCYRVESAEKILSLGTLSDMRHEVERRYDHALDVAMSRRAEHSTSPLFTWAKEAKASCAVALGFMKRWKLERPEVNEEAIQRCECFHKRMTAHGG